MFDWNPDFISDFDRRNRNSNRQRDAAEARDWLGRKANELLLRERSRRETSAYVDALRIHLDDLEAELLGLHNEWRGLEATAASLSKMSADMDSKTATLVNVVAAQTKAIQQQRGLWVAAMTSRIDHVFEGRRMEKLTDQLGTELDVVVRVRDELETGVHESREKLAKMQRRYEQTARDVATLEQLSELRVLGAQVYQVDALLMMEEARREWAAVNEQLIDMENNMQEEETTQHELRNDIHMTRESYRDVIEEVEYLAWS